MKNAVNKNMNYEQFAIWLHGFLEISDAKIIDETQTKIIKDHLALLFDKVTPDRHSEEKEEKSPTYDNEKFIRDLLEQKSKNIEKLPIQFPTYPTHPMKPYTPYWHFDQIKCSDSTADVAIDSKKTYC